MHKSEKFLIKKFLFIAVSLMLFIVVMYIPQMYALLSDGVSLINEVSIGGTSIEVLEDFEPPAQPEPGVEFKKDISIKNNGYSSCYVRVKAVFANSDIAPYCHVDWNNTLWVYNASDEYYYYQELLARGETTQSLFTTIKINDNAPQELIDDFEMLVYAEAVQDMELSGYAETWANYHQNKPSVTIPVTSVTPAGEE